MRTATIYNFLMEANIMASIAILLMLLVRRFLRKQLGNRAIYLAWLLVAIRLLCPLSLPNPAINEIRPPAVTDNAIRPIAGQLQVRFTDLTREMYYSAESSDLAETNKPLVETLNDLYDSTYGGVLSYRLFIVYLIGAALVLCYFAIANARFRHSLRAGRIEKISGKLLDQYNELCAARGIKPIPVYFTDPLPSACLVGVFRPYIALPLTAKPQDAIHVLTHEVCHLKGGDHLWGVLRLACCVVHWFNPLVWLAASLSRTDGELACDERVAAKLDPQRKLAYANVLVLAAAKRSAPGVAVLATGMTMTGKKLKTRVNAILHSGHIKKWFAIVFVALAMTALVCAFMTSESGVRPVMPGIRNAAVAQRAIASDEDALAYAQELWQNPYLNADVKDGAWSVRQMGGTYIVECVTPETALPLTLNILPDGTITFLYNAPSQVAGMHSDGTERYASNATEEISKYLRDFCHDVLNDASIEVRAFSFRGEGTQGAASFARFNGFYDMRGTNGVESSYVVQVAPVVRVVSYSVSQQKLIELTGVNAEPQAAEPAVQPAATAVPEALPVSGGSVLVRGFTATNKAPENDSFTLDIPEGTLSVENALGYALQAIYDKYSENEQSMARFKLSYGLRVDGDAYFQTPYWQFDFINEADLLDSYEIMIHSPDGAVVYTAGPNEGNG